MTTDVVTVHRQTAFKDIAGLFDRHRISAVPVVDAERHVIGVVSEADLLAKETDPGHPLPVTPGRRRHAKAIARRAHELMTAPAVTVGPDADVVTAARLLYRHAVKRLPVVDAAGVLVGIVGRRDVLRVFLRTDHDIATDVTEHVLRDALGTAPGTASADVTDGVVVLRGEVARRSMVPLAIAMTRAITGVVDVIEHLKYSDDDTTFTPKLRVPLPRR